MEKLDEQIAERESKRNTLEGMIQVVCGINEEQTEFDEELWGGGLITLWSRRTVWWLMLY